MSTKKNCVKCVNGSGIVTCDGCYQSFCSQHFSEHRQELTQEMNLAKDQCERFRQNLTQENDPAPLLSAIDDWETQSIEKIHVTAEKARTDVRQMTERTTNDFNQALNKITKKIDLSRKTNDVTETDLNNWTEQLQALQDLLQKPFPISLLSDEKPTAKIHFIHATYESPFAGFVQKKDKSKPPSSDDVPETPPTETKSVPVSQDERFDRVVGHAGLAEEGLVASCIGYSSMTGAKQYTSGIHRIRFRVLAKKNEGIFFGIVSARQKITARASEQPSVYGWRDFDRPIINGNAQLRAHREKNIENDNQLTLTMDCNRTELTLAHHQLRQKVQLTVDLQMCPFPWKLLVSSYGHDIIGLIH